MPRIVRSQMPRGTAGFGLGRRTSVPRSLAAAASPALAGALFAASFQALPLLICGTLKIAYDLPLLAQFRRLKPPEEQ